MMIKRSWPSRGHSLPEPAGVLRDLGRLFDAVYGEKRSEFAPGVFPALNVTRDEDSYFVRAELPGMNSDDLKISVERNKLSLAGTRQATEEHDVSYHRRERASGCFSRTITLPAEFDAEKVEARFDKGVLTITLPFASAAKVRQIPIHTA